MKLNFSSDPDVVVKLTESPALRPFGTGPHFESKDIAGSSLLTTKTTFPRDYNDAFGDGAY